MQLRWEEYGFGLFAVGGRRQGFIGFVGLAVPRFEVPFRHLTDPPVEVGWRLVRRAWGQGYASEGATACLHWAFGPLGLPEVLSWTAMANLRSRAVMERIGMHHDPADDFDHPTLPVDSPLRRHVVYRPAPQTMQRRIPRMGHPPDWPRERCARTAGMAVAGAAARHRGMGGHGRRVPPGRLPARLPAARGPAPAPGGPGPVRRAPRRRGRRGRPYGLRARARRTCATWYPPEVVTAALVAFETEGARLVATARQVALVEEALRGRRHAPRL